MLLSRVVAQLKSLELDADGYIKQNAANRATLKKAGKAFDPSSVPSYKKGIQSYVDTIPSVDKANDAYFNFLAKGLGPSKALKSSLQAQAISEIETLTLNQGIEAQIKAPLLNILNQNINSSAKFTDLLSQVSQFIVGSPEVEGQLLRYSKQITTDTLFNYSRSYQQAIATDLKSNWYMYSGGVTEGGKYSGGSRDFCLTRLGGYYTHKDVESWGKMNWQGQRRGTNSSTIFIYCGGYNCRHSLIPVDDSAVPKTNKDAKSLMKEAKQAGSELDKEATRIAEKNGAKLTPLNYKGYDSMVRKANSDLGGLVYKDGPIKGIQDSVRNTIIADADSIKNIKLDIEGSRIFKDMKVQNYTETGYRGYLSHVKLKNGTIGEIQINTPEMIFAKEPPQVAKAVIGEDTWRAIQKKTGLQGGLGHKYYEEERVINGTDEISEAKRAAVQKKSRDYYSKFYYSYPPKWP